LKNTSSIKKLRK